MSRRAEAPHWREVMAFIKNLPVTGTHFTTLRHDWEVATGRPLLGVTKLKDWLLSACKDTVFISDSDGVYFADTVVMVTVEHDGKTSRMPAPEAEQENLEKTRVYRLLEKKGPLTMPELSHEWRGMFDVELGKKGRLRKWLQTMEPIVAISKDDEVYIPGVQEHLLSVYDNKTNLWTTPPAALALKGIDPLAQKPKSNWANRGTRDPVTGWVEFPDAMAASRLTATTASGSTYSDSKDNEDTKRSSDAAVDKLGNVDAEWHEKGWIDFKVTKKNSLANGQTQKRHSASTKNSWAGGQTQKRYTASKQNSWTSGQTQKWHTASTTMTPGTAAWTESTGEECVDDNCAQSNDWKNNDDTDTNAFFRCASHDSSTWLTQRTRDITANAGGNEVGDNSITEHPAVHQSVDEDNDSGWECFLTPRAHTNDHIGSTSEAPRRRDDRDASDHSSWCSKTDSTTWSHTVESGRGYTDQHAGSLSEVASADRVYENGDSRRHSANIDSQYAQNHTSDVDVASNPWHIQNDATVTITDGVARVSLPITSPVNICTVNTAIPSPEPMTQQVMSKVAISVKPAPPKAPQMLPDCDTIYNDWSALNEWWYNAENYDSNNAHHDVRDAHTSWEEADTLTKMRWWQAHRPESGVDVASSSWPAWQAWDAPLASSEPVPANSSDVWSNGSPSFALHDATEWVDAWTV
eukprot:GEMP01020437.1.p1 GENE.GEMP01020437.1~~GEMP01020437.1.p1  ORF type:complete len:691 (+),score=162.96 GEMP01020437.1:129-2201(+)